MSHVIAFFLGVFVATVGLSGMANVADKGIGQVQQIMKEAADK